LRPFAFETTTPAWNGLSPLAWHEHDALSGIRAAEERQNIIAYLRSLQ